MSHRIPVIALLVSIAAMGWALFRHGFGPAPMPASAPDSAAQLDQLRQQVSALRTAQSNLAAQLDAFAGSRARGAPSNADIAQLEQRVGAIETRQEKLAQTTQQIDRFGVVSAMEKQLLAAYSDLLDSSQPLAARAKQAAVLKRYGHFDERAVRSLYEGFIGSDNLDDKSSALAALAGVLTSSQFRDQILVGLRADIQAGNRSARYRYHAIEALEPMAEDPAVRPWLVHLAQNDPEPKIAARAGQPVGITPPPPASANPSPGQ